MVAFVLRRSRNCAKALLNLLCGSTACRGEEEEALCSLAPVAAAAAAGRQRLGGQLLEEGGAALAACLPNLQRDDAHGCGWEAGSSASGGPKLCTGPAVDLPGLRGPRDSCKA